MKIKLDENGKWLFAGILCAFTCVELAILLTAMAAMAV